MTEEEKPEFVILVGALFESFGQESTKPRMLGYWIGLQDLTISEVKNGIKQALQSSDRLPTPVELRRLSGERTGDQKALAAWVDLQRTIPLGPYRHIDFSDGCINGVVRLLGGWPNVVSRFGSAEEEKWLRIEFCKAYQSLESSCADGEVMAPLAGLSEAQVIGGKVTKPVPQRIACAVTTTAAAIEDKRKTTGLIVGSMLGRA